MEKYRCKRCGYQGKLMGDIKRHYQKKYMCDAVYCDLTYEELLQRLEMGLHSIPIHHKRSSSVIHQLNQTTQDAQSPPEASQAPEVVLNKLQEYETIKKEYTIQHVYMIPETEDDDELVYYLSKYIKHIRANESMKHLKIALGSDKKLMMLD